MPSEHQDNIYFEKNEIDQLHNAILEISKQCFDLKKTCITVLVAIFAIIPNIRNTSSPLDYKTLYNCISICAPLFFYLTDSYCYYYQRKLRSRMENIIKKAKYKHSIEYYYGNTKDTTIRATVFNAMFNTSHCFYLILILLLLGMSSFLAKLSAI